MTKTNKQCPFWPKGCEWYHGTIVVVLVFFCGFASFQLYLSKIEQDYNSFNDSAWVKVRPDQSQFSEVVQSDDHIRLTGFQKDGIPALTDPQMLPAERVDWLNDDDQVVGLVINQKPMAFPLRILHVHECINASRGEHHYAVTYCPLCDSVNVWNRRLDGEILEFGVSGLLMQNNVLLYDRQSSPEQENLWCQLDGKAISGPKKGRQLMVFHHQVLSWKNWLKRHPNTVVMSRDTGYQQQYEIEHDSQYLQSDKIYFPVKHTSELFAPKERVVGITANGEAKAYPIRLIEAENKRIQDRVGGVPVTLEWLENDEVVVVNSSEEISVTHCLWFAWYTFNPKTLVYSGSAFDLQQWQQNNADHQKQG